MLVPITKTIWRQKVATPRICACNVTEPVTSEEYLLYFLLFFYYTGGAHFQLFTQGVQFRSDTNSSTGDMIGPEILGHVRMFLFDRLVFFCDILPRLLALHDKKLCESPKAPRQHILSSPRLSSPTSPTSVYKATVGRHRRRSHNPSPPFPQRPIRGNNISSSLVVSHFTGLNALCWLTQLSLLAKSEIAAERFDFEK